MFVKSVSATVVAIAATLVSAQTSTECQPLNGTCPANSAVGRNRIDCDLTQGPCSAFFNLEGTVISYDESGAVFSIEREGQAPTIESHDYIFFGRVEVELQGALGRGIVTSSVLESADLDEIDWEMVGADLQRVQSNYFGKGDLSSYDRGGFHAVADPLTTTHTYTLEWTAEKLEWIIDGSVIRTLRYEDAQGGTRYPQTPMKIKLGTWVGGGRNSPEGTVEWAGGYTDFSQAPFVARYKRITIVDYAGGSGPTTDDIREYVYGDQSGSWESIRVVKADGSIKEPSEPSEPQEPQEPSTFSTTTTTTTTTTSTTKIATTPSTTTVETTTSTTEVESTTSTTEVESTTSTTEVETSASASTETTHETTFTTFTTDGSSTTTPAPATTSGGNADETESNEDAPNGSDLRATVSGFTVAILAGVFMVFQLL